MEEKKYYRYACRSYLRQKLALLIRDVCQLYGEDDDFTNQYINDVLNLYEKKPGLAVACFEDLKKQAKEVLGLTKWSHSHGCEEDPIKAL